MRSAVLLVGLMALFSSAHAWSACNANWKCRFGLTTSGDYRDCVKGQFAQKAVEQAAAKVAPLLIEDDDTAVYKGCRVIGIRGKDGCYSPLRENAAGQQLLGQYGFEYVLTFHCPNGKKMVYTVWTKHVAKRNTPNFVRFVGRIWWSGPEL